MSTRSRARPVAHRRGRGGWTQATGSRHLQHRPRLGGAHAAHANRGEPGAAPRFKGRRPKRRFLTVMWLQCLPALARHYRHTAGLKYLQRCQHEPAVKPSGDSASHPAKTSPIFRFPCSPDSSIFQKCFKCLSGLHGRGIGTIRKNYRDYTEKYRDHTEEVSGLYGRKSAYYRDHTEGLSVLHGNRTSKNPCWRGLFSPFFHLNPFKLLFF